MTEDTAPDDLVLRCRRASLAIRLMIVFGAAVALTACAWQQHQTPDHLPPPPNMSAPSGPPPPVQPPGDSGISQ
jgi:hypothetical protein